MTTEICCIRHSFQETCAKKIAEELSKFISAEKVTEEEAYNAIDFLANFFDSYHFNDCIINSTRHLRDKFKSNSTTVINSGKMCAIKLYALSLQCLAEIYQ